MNQHDSVSLFSFFFFLVSIFAVEELLNQCLQLYVLGMGGMELYADDYCLIAGDLREFTTHVVDRLIQHGFDTRSVNAQSYEYFIFILPSHSRYHLPISSFA